MRTRMLLFSILGMALGLSIFVAGIALVVIQLTNKPSAPPTLVVTSVTTARAEDLPAPLGQIFAVAGFGNITVAKGVVNDSVDTGKDIPDEQLANAVELAASKGSSDILSVTVTGQGASYQLLALRKRFNDQQKGLVTTLQPPVSIRTFSSTNYLVYLISKQIK